MNHILDDLGQASLGRAHPLATPAMDLIDHPDYAELRLNLPGVDPSQVDIQFQDGVLTISSSVAQQKHYNNSRYTYHERYCGAYRRSLRVGDNLDISQARASFENGVLSLTIPKREEAQPLRIAVRPRQLDGDTTEGQAEG